MKKVLFGIIVLGSAGCTSLFEGGYQSIAVETSPPNATCEFYNSDNVVFAEVIDGGVTYDVRRSRLPIRVVCGKTGFIDQTVVLNSVSDTSKMVGGLYTDMWLGATHSYPSSVSVTLEKR